MTQDDDVGRQYEAYPYPDRDPAEERARLISGSPSQPDEINHYVFAGRRDFSQPFRALVAGGGTGDGTIMLAQLLADRGCPAEIVHLEPSRASARVAEARARVRGLENINFVAGSLLELSENGLGPFDYVDCCGVLHHLEDPGAGLKALGGALAPGGGMGVMLYGELGRTGVYHMQDMMRALGAGREAADRIALARRLLGALPETNWLRRNDLLGDHLEGGDAGLFDLLLHSRDRAYRVPEIIALAGSAGLAISGYAEPARYDPASYLSDRKLLAPLDDLARTERWAFAELLAGNIRKHVFYMVPEARVAAAVARPAPDAVPHLRELDGEAFARDYRPGNTMRAELDGFAFRFPLPPLAGAMVRRMDGRASLAEIHQTLTRVNPDLDWKKFFAQFETLYAAFNGLGKLFLSCPAKGD
jgi:SAM-dependent methyltransferase